MVYTAQHHNTIGTKYSANNYYRRIMLLQKLLSPFRRAINDYDLIRPGDKVAVGVSGGKDSMALLQLLRAYQRFSDRPFELMAITIDLGFEEGIYAPITQYCADNDIPYHIEHTDIGEIIFDIRKESNPCSLCTKMRRGALNTILKQHGCNKLALGHHLNDVVETFMLSLFHEGRLSSFAPISYMDRSDVTVIRPMVYLHERELTALARNLPVVANPCPADKHTERESMKSILRTLQADYPDIDNRFARAIMNPDRYNLWDNVLSDYNKQYYAVHPEKNPANNVDTAVNTTDSE